MENSGKQKNWSDFPSTTCKSRCFITNSYKNPYILLFPWEINFSENKKIEAVCSRVVMTWKFPHPPVSVCRPRWPHIVHWSGSTVLICSVQTTSHSKPTTLVGMYVITYVIFVWFLGAFTIKSCKKYWMTVSFSLTSCKNWRTSERVFMKFDVRSFVEIFLYIPILVEIGQQ